MLAFAALCLAQTSGYQQSVDRAAQAIDRAKRLVAIVAVETTFQGKQSQTRMNIAFSRPDTLRFNIQEPQQEGVAATNRSYLIDGSKALGVDFEAHEYLERKALDRGSLYQRAVALVGDLGEPFGCAVDGATLKASLGRFAKMGEWKSTKRMGNLVWVAANRTNKATLSVEFFANGFLSAVDLKQGDSRTRWRFTYAPGDKPALSPPGSFRKVNQFTARNAPPQFADVTARMIYNRAANAHDVLLHYALIATVDGRSSSHLWVSNRQVREEASDFIWTYSRGVCSIWKPSTKTLYTGKATAGELVEALANAGVSLSAAGRRALLGQNPMRTLLTRDFKVSSAGSIKLNGVNLNVLRVQSRFWSGELQIASKSYLLKQIIARPMDRNGKPVSTSTTDFLYANVGVAIDSKLFRLATPQDARAVSIRTLIDPR